MLAIMKKSKNGHYFIKMPHMEKFQISDPPKVWVSGHIFMKWQPFCDFFCQHSKTRYPNFAGGIGDLKIFCMMHIYKMVAIF